MSDHDQRVKRWREYEVRIKESAACHQGGWESLGKNIALRTGHGRSPDSTVPIDKYLAAAAVTGKPRAKLGVTASDGHRMWQRVGSIWIPTEQLTVVGPALWYTGTWQRVPFALALDATTSAPCAFIASANAYLTKVLNKATKEAA